MDTPSIVARIGRALAVGGAGAVALAVTAWWGTSAWVFRGIPAPLPAVGPVPGLADDRASTCAACHPDQARDWASTRMAQAFVDPAFAADFEAQGRPFPCRACHTPLAEQQPTVVTGLWWIRPLIPRESPNLTFAPDRMDEGVTCVACHWHDGAMVGPGRGPSVHPTRAGSEARGACERCHQLDPPPLSNLVRPMPDTHREWDRWRAATGRSEDCVDCHMPGGRHLWKGGWDVDTLRAGLGVTATFDGDVVHARLENRAGHNFPSGDPARALVLRAGGAEVVLARRVPLPRYRDLHDDTLLPAEVRGVEVPWDGASPLTVSFEPLRFLDLPVDRPVLPLFSLAADEPVDGLGDGR